MMPTKKINFTEAREKFSNLIEEVQRSGRPVTITKRGRPAAVLVNCEVFEQKMAGPKQKPWKLRGSGKIVKGVDIDESIREMREKSRRAHGESIQQLIRDLSED